MNKVVELFGYAQDNTHVNWPLVVAQQQCPFIGRRCYKVRKSDPAVSIGTCTVFYGREPEPIIICPTRLIDRSQIFIDCLHLLTNHEPGNEIHVVSEVPVPGGSVDYFLVSVQNQRVRDFVGIELQTLDTTGTVWPERQRLLRDLGIPRAQAGEELNTSYGMNWKMTAKTILVQMHHKALTFQHVNKKLVLVVQDKLLRYMEREFRFDHLNRQASLGDAVHLHAYQMGRGLDGNLRINLCDRFSTDVEGVGAALGLQAEARVELEQIIASLQAKISAATRLVFI